MTPDDGDGKQSGFADTAASDTQPEVRGSRPTLAPTGYEIGEVIGQGGMGEIVSARDRRIGRNVAIKRMRGAAPSHDATARFLREARIQARLDHPAIVPVHELGEDSEGRPYFTMKRLTGTTLADALKAGASHQTMLRAFVDVCLAVEFAHSRNVVHRDLKPSNIMMGDFGEVYVLDWGIARVLGDDTGATAIPTLDPDLQGATQQGTLLGTPGYMAPEQIGGPDVGPPADVYALGAILFEILSGESLHPSGRALETTLDPALRPSQRSPRRSIPPELDDACIAALALDPTKRSTARELSDRIQRYLDGDRDLEHRRALAADHLGRARTAMATPSKRGDAIFESGRALVLDPTSAEAAALVTRLTIDPPQELPAEVVERLEDLDNELARKQWRSVGLAYTSFYLLMPIVFVLKVKSWLLFGLEYSFVTIMIAMCLRNARAARPWEMLTLAVNALGVVMFTRVLGPFFSIGLLSIIMFGWCSYPTSLSRPWVPLATMLCALATPFVLEAIGVFETTWAITGDAVVSRSSMTIVDSAAGTAVVLSLPFALLTVGGLMAHQLALARREAQRKVEIQAWQLRKLLPG